MRYALVLSGNYRSFRTDARGKRRSHIIDPRTGAPIAHALAAFEAILAPAR